MSERKIRLGRFDKYGYKNIFSKGELARELVYTNEDNDNLKQTLNDIRDKVKILGKYDGEKCTRGFSMYSADFNDILQIIDKAVGDEKQ